MSDLPVPTSSSNMADASMAAAQRRQLAQAFESIAQHAEVAQAMECMLDDIEVTAWVNETRRLQGELDAALAAVGALREREAALLQREAAARVQLEQDRCARLSLLLPLPHGMSVVVVFAAA